MAKAIIFLLVLLLLFVIPAWILRATYGPSYHFLSGHHCWIPDGNGGWLKHGPLISGPPPEEPSVKIPILVMYIPVLLPGLLVVLVLGYASLSKAFYRKINIPERGG